MDKVRKYLRKAYGQNIRDNGYWDYVIYNHLRHGIDYDTNFEQVLDSVTASDVQRVANDLLRQNRRIEITMISDWYIYTNDINEKSCGSLLLSKG